MEYRYKIPPSIKPSVDRIKRLSYEVLDGHKSKFGEDFADNKKALDQVSIIRSKCLKNEVAGYITKFIKKEIREEKDKQARIESLQSEELVEPQVQAEIFESATTSSEETTQGEYTTAPLEVPNSESTTSEKTAQGEDAAAPLEVPNSESTTSEKTAQGEDAAAPLEVPNSESDTTSEETAKDVETTLDQATKATEEKTE